MPTGYTGGMAKVMVSVPDELLARIDTEARRRMTTRSGLLALAATHELERGDSRAYDDAIQRSRSRFLGAVPFEAADLVRAERNGRR